MPRWDFYCKKCDNVVELAFANHELSKKAKCPNCKIRVERLASSALFNLVGKGFHKNDYK